MAKQNTVNRNMLSCLDAGWEVSLPVSRYSNESYKIIKQGLDLHRREIPEKTLKLESKLLSVGGDLSSLIQC